MIFLNEYNTNIKLKTITVIKKETPTWRFLKLNKLKQYFLQPIVKLLDIPIFNQLCQ